MERILACGNWRGVGACFGKVFSVYGNINSGLTMGTILAYGNWEAY